MKILFKDVKGTASMPAENGSFICENGHFCKVHASGEDVDIVCHECKESKKLHNVGVIHD